MNVLFFNTSFHWKFAISNFMLIKVPVRIIMINTSLIFIYKQNYFLFIYNSSKSLVLAGLFAGLTEAIVVNPFEVVKVRLQTDQAQFSMVFQVLFLIF